MGTKGARTREQNKQKLMPALQEKITPAPAQILRIAESEPAHHKINIRWDSQETKLVAAKTAELLMKQGIGAVPDKGDYVGARFVLDAIREAQCQVLERNRRRLAQNSRAAYNRIFWGILGHQLKELARDKESARNLEAAKIAPAPPPSVPAPQTPTPLKPLPAAFATPMNSFEAMIDARVRTITGQMEDFFTEELGRMEKEIEALKTLAARVTKPGEYEAPKPAIPKVGIFGALPDQFAAIVTRAKESGMELDLRDFPTGESKRDITVDWAIQLRFNRHATQEQIKAVNIPPSQIAFIRGGLTGVVRQLEAWFKNE